MSIQQTAGELTKAWIECAKPTSWIEIAEAYTGIAYAATKHQHGDSSGVTATAQKAATHFSELALRLRQSLSESAEAPTLAQLEAQESKGR
jgi:hypothetical protein